MNIPGAPVNMAFFIREWAGKLPNKRAVVFPQGRDSSGRVSYTHLSFRQLEDESNRYARGLKKLGIQRGMRTALMLTPSLEFFAVTFALFKIGAVVVLIDPGIGIQNLGKCLGEAAPEAFIGVTKAHAARVLLRWSPATIRICVTHGTRLFWGGQTLAQARDENPAPEAIPDMGDEMGAIMFTSGSTGISKGAVYTHGILTNQVRFIQELYQFNEHDVDLATFPLFALLDVCLGTTVVIPDMDATRPADADPAKLIEGIENNGATVMFGSPALVNTLSRYAETHGIKLSTLRTVISCGAPARNDVLARFQKTLPETTQIHTPYGATEALPISSIGSHEILGETAAETARGGGTCVGRPVPQVTVRIIKISDEPIAGWSESLLLPVGVTGEIAVSGPIVTREYYMRPEATAGAKIRAADGTIWHRMGDCGRIDAAGRLWFCGRKAHRVETESRTLFTIPCEAVFNQHPKVFRTALVGIGPRDRQIPVLCVELEKNTGPVDEAALANELLALGATHEHTREIRRILFHSGFPVDVRHNAKIGREQLALWAEEHLRAAAPQKA